jgi:DNA (cytosine-5)-methyltransferase 1
MTTPLHVGTDCSGIEAPLEALNQLLYEGEIPFSEIRHLFSSDIDKWCRESIKSNHSPEQLYTDMIKRDNKEAPEVDLYVCGFPCQPFSIAGKRGGMADPRGTVIHGCIDYIKTKKPKYFILENVMGLITHNAGDTWNVIQNLLSSLVDYNISHKLLNTKNYGIPQNRERLFIVGIRQDLVRAPFEFPLPIPLTSSIHDYIDTQDTQTDSIRQDVINSGMLEKIPKDAVFVDFAFKKYHYPNSGTVCPCIAADSRTWCVPMGRYANIKERLALQGFRTDEWKQTVSDTQMKKQIGNSMSVNVLKELIRAIFLVTKSDNIFDSE